MEMAMRTTNPNVLALAAFDPVKGRASDTCRSSPVEDGLEIKITTNNVREQTDPAPENDCYLILTDDVSIYTSRKHTYIILTSSNPTLI